MYMRVAADTKATPAALAAPCDPASANNSFTEVSRRKLFPLSNLLKAPQGGNLVTEHESVYRLTEVTAHADDHPFFSSIILLYIFFFSSLF